MDYLAGLFKNSLHTGFTASIMILIIIVIRAIFKNKVTAKTCYILWLILLVRLIFPFSIQSPASFENFYAGITDEREQVNEFAETTSDADIGTPIPKEPGPYEGANERIGIAEKIAGLESAASNSNIFPILSYIWLFGIIAVISVPVISYIVLRSELKGAREAADENIIRSSGEICKTMSISRPARVVYSNVCAKPALAGIVNPVIILPEYAGNYAYDKIHPILLHEYIHYKKKHLLIQWLFWPVKAAFWFNPLIWLASKLMKQDAECWCDEEVLRFMDKNQRISYGRLMLEMAEEKEDPAVALNVTGFGNRLSEIRRRIFIVTRNKKASKIATIIVACMALCIVPVFYTVKADFQSPAPAEKLIRHSLEPEERQTENGALRLLPIGYEYNTKSQVLTVFIDYSVGENLQKAGISESGLVMYMKVAFPGSSDPDVRKKSYTGSLVKGNNGKIAAFSFQIPGYDYGSYGMARLIFEEAQVNIPVPEEDKYRSIIIEKNDIPYSIEFKSLAKFTFSEMLVNQDQNIVSTVMESESYTGFRTEPHIIFSVTKNDMTVKASSINGTISYSDSRLIVKSDMRFDLPPEDNVSLLMDIESVSLYIGNQLIDNQIKDKMSWRFSIV